MTAKAKEQTAAATTPPAEQPAPVESEAPARVPSNCVVDEPFHVGRAVNGKVCSYHAMRYRADGTRR